MGIFERFSRLLKANVNSLLDRAEDKTKLQEQAILDLEESRKKAQELRIASMAKRKLAVARQEACDKEASSLVREAQALLGSSDETGAKKAIARKQIIASESAGLREEIAEHSRTISTIDHGLEAIDAKIKSLRYNRANEEALHDTSAFDTFKRMEEKIEYREAELEALDELLEAKDQSFPPTESPKTPKSELSLEQEIDALKKKLIQ